MHRRLLPTIAIREREESYETQTVDQERAILGTAFAIAPSALASTTWL
jgi:hypothetical protein